jgi:hypothetical protein
MNLERVSIRDPPGIDEPEDKPVALSFLQRDVLVQ